MRNKMRRAAGTAVLLCVSGMLLAEAIRARQKKNYDYIVTEEEFDVDGTDKVSDAKGIQRALAKAVGTKQEVTIYFPEGKYYIDKTLRIYSNTHLILDDNVTIYRMDSMVDRGLLHNVDQDGHMDCHLIEFVGIKDGLISGCTLTGFCYRKGHTKDWTYAREAIQLESAWTNNESDKSDISSLWAKGSVVDGTSCR